MGLHIANIERLIKKRFFKGETVDALRLISL